MKFLGILFIIIGIVMILTESVSVGYTQIEIHGFLKYLVAIPQVFFGIYIVYLSSRQNKGE